MEATIQDARKTRGFAYAGGRPMPTKLPGRDAAHAKNKASVAFIIDQINQLSHSPLETEVWCNTSGRKAAHAQTERRRRMVKNNDRPKNFFPAA